MQHYYTMDVEVSELEVKASEFGRLVPQHLLEFQADKDLECYFRGVMVNNYEKGINHSNLGMCSSCFGLLTVHDQPRLRPGMKRTRKLTKLLEKSKSQKLSKHQEYLLSKYLNSSCYMKIKCPACGFVNRMPVFKRKDCLAHREELHKSALDSASQIKEVEATSSKKKKKRKRKDFALVQNPDIPTNSLHNSTLFQLSPAPVSKTSDKLLLFGSRTPANDSSTPFQRGRRKQQTHTSPVRKNLKHKQALQAFLKTREAEKPSSSSLKDFLSSL